MFEDLRVTAGQVIVDEAMVLARTEEDQLELAVRHAQLVYRIAYSVLRNHHDAEDATQETFVRVLRAKRKLNAVDDPRKWIAKIAWRVAVERRKKTAGSSAGDHRRNSYFRTTVAIGFGGGMCVGAGNAWPGSVLISALPTQLRDALTLSTVQSSLRLRLLACWK